MNYVYLLWQSFYSLPPILMVILMFSRVLGQKLGMLSSHDSNNKEKVSLKTRSSYFKPLRIFLGHVTCLMWQNYNRVFSDDVTVAILVYQKQWNGSLIGVPSQSCWGWGLGVLLNTFFCSNKFTKLLVMWVKMLYRSCIRWDDVHVQTKEKLLS